MLVLANEAVEITASTDWLHLRGLTLEDRAEVEAAAGRTSAEALHERKGNVTAARRARQRFEKAGA